MNTLNILHIGLGNVGREVQAQIEKQKESIGQSLGVSLEYKGAFTSKNSEEEIHQAIAEVSLPFVFIDTTASDATMPFMEKALEKGGFVVMANKKPISGSLANYEKLHQLGSDRLFYETTVGAGLPVIQTLKNLLATGDEIVAIQGCFSGTLGFLFSELDNGKTFSQAVLDAKAKGFTEPDPRDDLSGMDVARKALILSRLIGKNIELNDIKLTGLFPDEMKVLSSDEFLQKVRDLDASYSEKIEVAKKEKKVLRFIATVTPESTSVGLEAIDKASDIGSLSGPDNLIVFKTKRYLDNPLVIKGPGAGREVTAAGVFADVLSVARIIKG